MEVDMSAFVWVSDLQTRVDELKKNMDVVTQELQQLDAARQQSLLRLNIMQGAIAVLEDVIRTNAQRDGV